MYIWRLKATTPAHDLMGQQHPRHHGVALWPFIRYYLKQELHNDCLELHQSTSLDAWYFLSFILIKVTNLLAWSQSLSTWRRCLALVGHLKAKFSDLRENIFFWCDIKSFYTEWDWSFNYLDWFFQKYFKQFINLVFEGWFQPVLAVDISMIHTASE